MRRIVPDMYKFEAVLEVEYAHSVRSTVVMLLTITAGVVSGILLLTLRFAGWIMAIVLCAGFLLLRIVALFRYYPDVWGRIKVIFTLLLPLHPVPVIYSEIITPLFFIGTVAFLTRKSVSRQFIVRNKLL